MQNLVPSLSAQASPQPEEDCFLDWGFLSAHHWNIPATGFRTGIVAGGYRVFVISGLVLSWSDGL